MPAVTIVAECSNAETGVGPSIASGSQECKPICADFPIHAPSKNKHIKSTLFTLNPENSKKIGQMSFFINKKTVLKSKLLKKRNTYKKAIYKKKSPTLFRNIAFNADLLASGLTFQKLINRYELIPIPSHPRKNCNMLEAKTITTIKKVKRLM